MITASYKTMLTWIIGLALSLLAIRYVIPIFAPFILGLIFVAIIEPGVKLLEERLRVPRSVGVLFMLFLAIVLMVGLSILILGQVVSELEQLVKLLPRYEKDAIRWTNEQIVQWKGYYERLPAPVIDAINGSGQSIYTRVVAVLQSILNWIRTIPNLVITLVISFLTAYFISRDKGKAYSSLEKWAERDASKRRMVKKFATIRTSVVHLGVAYIKAQLLLMAITTVIIVILLLFMRIQYAWLIGIAAGLLDVLPMIGPAAIFVPWALVLLLIGAKTMAIKLLIILGISMGIRQIFEAKIVGKSLQIHPLLTLIVLYVSVRILGISGFVFGPLLIIVGKALVKANVFHKIS